MTPRKELFIKIKEALMSISELELVDLDRGQLKGEKYPELFVAALIQIGSISWETMTEQNQEGWQRARLVRRSEENPQNYPLQEVYEDTMMDGQLSGITENRTFRTTNKDFIFVDKEGKKDDACTDFIKEKTWFEDFIKFAHESVYYGTEGEKP